MGYGAFTVVWPYDEHTTTGTYSNTKKEKLAKKRISIFFFVSRGLEHCGPFISIIIIKHRRPKGDCYLNSIRKSWLLELPQVAHYYFSHVYGRPWVRRLAKRVPPHFRCPNRSQGRKKKNKKLKKRNLKFFFQFRIVMRGLNLMRSMQQGISTHYNTRHGI